MARYIDADLIDLTKYKIGRSLAIDWIDIEDVKRAIALTPTADVVPKSEVERLQEALDEYEETSGLKQAKAEVAREIFEEIDAIIFGTIIPNDCAIISIAKLAELKKKYMEDKT